MRVALCALLAALVASAPLRADEKGSVEPGKAKKLTSAQTQAQLKQAREAWLDDRADEAIKLLGGALERGQLEPAVEREQRLEFGRWLGGRAGMDTLSRRARELGKALRQAGGDDPDPVDHLLVGTLYQLGRSMVPRLAVAVGGLLPEELPKETAAQRALAIKIRMRLTWKTAPAGLTTAQLLKLEAWLRTWENTFRAADRKRLRAAFARDNPGVSLPALSAVIGREPLSLSRLSRGRSQRDLVVSADGSRTTYELYVPQRYTAFKARPLMVFLHGKGKAGKDCIEPWIPLAEKLGWIICCPEAPRKWVNEGFGDSDAERSTALSAIDDLRRRGAVDPRRIYVGGRSMGGHVAWSVALHHPDRVTAILPMGGAPRMVRYRLLPNLKHVWVFNAVGGLEDERLLSGARFAVSKLAGEGGKVKLYEDPVRGREFLAEAPPLFAKWVAEARRPAVPKEVVMRMNGAFPRRSFWLEILEYDNAIKDNPSIPSAIASLPAAMRRVKWIELLEGNVAEVKGRLTARNTISLEMNKKLHWVRLYLSPEMVDFSRKVKVLLNGKPILNKRVTPRVPFLLETTRRQRDRLYWAAVDIRPK